MRKELNEKTIKEDTTLFHSAGKAELLLVFDVFEPNRMEKTISKYHHIGAKVYACSDAQISEYIKEFGKKDDEKNEVYVAIGKLASNNALCSVSLNSLFCRYCAVIGATGGGKSWTVAKLIEGTKKYSNSKVILFDATEEYKNLADKSYVLGIDSNFPYQKLSVFDLFYLLRPKGQSQRPILLEAIRSLKIQIAEIEDNLCNFNINLLAKQIREECVYPRANYSEDLPIGTLSQIGTFIVHRLINDSDKKTVENAVCSANKNLLLFLPMLGAGEVLLIGVDFPMPLILKIDKPKIKPDSNTPKLKPA